MAVYMPNEMNFEGKNFSMIISGSPGTGKTTLALSAPDPVLVDFDEGVSRVKACHRKPTILGDTYEEIRHDIETSPLVKQCKTIVIDTGGAFITYLQDWAIRDNPTANKQKNSNAISQKGFGAVKQEFVRFTNYLRSTMKKNVVYIFHTVEEKDGDVVKYRLMCEGSAKNIVWQPCDLGAYLQMIGDKRYLGFTPTEQYFAKGCYGIKGLIEVPELTDGTPNDMLTRLFQQARENIAQEAAEGAKETAAYSRAMEQAKAILETVEDAGSATAAATRLGELEHALSSKRESLSMLQAKVKELGLRWDKAGKQYVQNA